MSRFLLHMHPFRSYNYIFQTSPNKHSGSREFIRDDLQRLDNCIDCYRIYLISSLKRVNHKMEIYQGPLLKNVCLRDHAHLEFLMGANTYFQCANQISAMVDDESDETSFVCGISEKAFEVWMWLMRMGMLADGKETVYDYIKKMNVGFAIVTHWQIESRGQREYIRSYKKLPKALMRVPSWRWCNKMPRPREDVDQVILWMTGRKFRPYTEEEQEEELHADDSQDCINRYIRNVIIYLQIII